MTKHLQVHPKKIKTFLVLLLFSLTAYPQNLNTEQYQYISPTPGSRNINPGNNIIIRQGSVIDKSTLADDLIDIKGSKSGIHKGQLILSDDLKTLVFLPDRKFALGEEVNISLAGKIRTIHSQELTPLHFNFFIKSVLPTENDLKALDIFLASEDEDLSREINPENISNTSAPDSINHYPDMILNTKNNPSPGVIFQTLLYPGQDSYLTIMDNSGIPVFYRRFPGATRNLLLQPDGSLTYFDHSKGKFFQMDSSYTIIDSFYCRNGFEATTGFHEFIHLENGHSYLLARDNRVVRMDSLVAGGDSTAIVSGFVIQEQDASNNVIFQWNTFEHFQVTDATEDVNLLGHNINPFHCNSLAIDNDGNLLLSSRYLDEITKINRQTGEIIWRLGGSNSANNEFQFINDTRTFSHQHCARRLPNGNLILFDNGSLFSPQFTRVVEYELDEINKTATQVWEFFNNPANFTGAAGSVQRFSDDKTLIGWGVSKDSTYGLTETDLDGNITLDFSYPENYTSYRAFKYSWETNLFLTDPDSIFYESIQVEDSAFIEFTVKNNSSQPLEITDFYNKDLQFSIDHTVPFTIQPFQTEMLQLKFKPTSEGYFTDEMHIRSETDTSLIAKVITLGGRTDSTFTGVENEFNNTDFKLEQNYPNPFNPSTTISFSVPEKSLVILKVFDVLGNEVKALLNQEMETGYHLIKLDAEGLSSGVYFYRIVAGKYSKTRKMLILK